MVTINEYNTDQITAINKLILKYREGLTNGPMNSCGGFSVRNTKNNTPSTIRVEFDGNKLDVVNVSGQICGFISNPDTPDTRKFYFLNQMGNNTDKLDIPKIEAWYTRPQQSQKQSAQEEQVQKGRGKTAKKQQSEPGYGGRKSEIIPYPNVDRRYEGCPPDLNLSLASIDNQFKTLFSSTKICPQDQMAKSFFTFLLMGSEGAKNSLVHEQIITKLITSAIDKPYGPLSKGAKDPLHRAFIDTILLAAKNCGNGEINYVSQPIKCKKIMDNFGMNTFAEHANVSYQGDNLTQTYVNIIDSGNYQDCHRVLRDEPRTGKTREGNAEAADLPVPSEESDLGLIVFWKQAALRLEGGGSRPPAPPSDDNDDEDIPNLSDLFTNEELGSSPNPGLDNDSTFSPTNNGFESPSPGNSQPLDKGNHDEKASLSEANIIEVLEIEANPEVPESSMKNDDPDDLGVKPNPGGSENSTENKLCDTITKKAALFNKIGVTKDDECLALVDKIKKKTAQALTAKAEATNTSVYTPTFKPGGL